MGGSVRVRESACECVVCECVCVWVCMCCVGVCVGVFVGVCGLPHGAQQHFPRLTLFGLRQGWVRDDLRSNPDLVIRVR